MPDGGQKAVVKEAGKLSPLALAAQELATVLSPEADLDVHLAEVEAVADGVLARLDELTATLGAVSADSASQQAALEPAFRAITAGLARDFAYVDGVGVREPPSLLSGLPHFLAGRTNQHAP
jgi:hypothetical protein